MEPSGEAGREKPLLEARNITKYFGAITALDGVNFHLSRGEVLGVVGDNGAGKSTLMKILSGLYAPSAGEIIFEGRPVRFSSPRHARDVGIEMVYQDLALAGNLAIHENIYLGREPGSKVRSACPIVDQAKQPHTWRPSTSTVSRSRSRASTRMSRTFPAASSRPSPSPAPPRSTPAWSSWTSRPRRWPSRKSARFST